MFSRRDLDGPFDYNRYPPRTAAGSGAGGQNRRTATPSITNMADTTPPSNSFSSSGPQRRNPRDVQPGAPPPAPRRRLPPHAVDELPQSRSGPYHRVPPASGTYSARDRWAEQERTRHAEIEEAAGSEDNEAAAPAAPLRRRAKRGHTARRQSIASGRGAAPRPFWKVIRLWAAVLLLLGLAELGVAALTAPQFAVAGVDITGLDVTPEETVRSIATQLEGRNWLQAQTAGVERAVEGLPTVKSAKIGHVLSWPPRLALEVEERRPFLKVGAGQDWWIADNQGVPFRRATAEDSNLYAVTGPKIEPVAGRPLPPEVWRSVAQLVTVLREDDRLAGEDRAGSFWKLRRIYLDKNGFASLRLKGGAQDSLLVRLGDERWRDKLQRARQALAYFQRAGARAEVLNLVSFNMPTWTPHREFAQADSTSANLPSELPPVTADSIAAEAT